ncbi:hypothetical protein Hypma_012682 [Hypsizygus marmoreus]|uniref:Uncharacterized protein n=1 Tax=Hypsizygus marmoreus TaxID=39966 RepID=A0A369JLI2_HYPMA|nr:hypothetical protein Hypma_012682 [Hypsizygus marmoreus]
MRGPPPPYILEDRTGSNTATDFDDLYDRIFFRIARVPDRTTTMIYSMNIRGSRHRDSLPFNQQPIAILDFAQDERLGNISYVQHPHNLTMPMHRYLRKTSLFGASLLRKFTASDGLEYKWGHRVIEGQEWSLHTLLSLTQAVSRPECTTMDNYLIAHFDLNPPNVRSYDPSVSGNYLTIYQHSFHLTLELVASLTIMRHIAQHNL